MKKNNKNGFSLMELIIVIIIIGILIGAIVGLSNLKNIAKASLIYEQGLKIKSAIDISMKENGHIFYRNFLTNDRKIAQDNVINTNKFNKINPFGFEWSWEGENPAVVRGAYSDNLVLKTNVPKNLCDSIKSRFSTSASVAICTAPTRALVNGGNVKVDDFLELRITFNGE